MIFVLGSLSQELPINSNEDGDSSTGIELRKANCKSRNAETGNWKTVRPKNLVQTNLRLSFLHGAFLRQHFFVRKSLSLLFFVAHFFVCAILRTYSISLSPQKFVWSYSYQKYSSTQICSILHQQIFIHVSSPANLHPHFFIRKSFTCFSICKSSSTFFVCKSLSVILRPQIFFTYLPAYLVIVPINGDCNHHKFWYLEPELD